MCDGQVEARTDAQTRRRTRLDRRANTSASSTDPRRRSLLRAIRPRASCMSRRAPCGCRSCRTREKRPWSPCSMQAISSARAALRASRSGWQPRRPWPPCTILAVEKQEMVRQLHAQPAFADRFLTHMLTRNIRIEEDLIDQLFNSSEKRLARTLLLLARYGEPEASHRALPRVSQEVLAEMVGTTRSRVNFFMNKFRKLGFIDYNGGLKINNSLLSVVLRDCNGRFLRAVRLSGLRRSRRGRAGQRRSQPSASVPGRSRSSDRAPQSRTSRTASATPIETIVRWHCRSAPRSDRAHLERLDR